MIVSDNFIFIRIPRTASSSIERVLKQYHNIEYDKIYKTPRTRSKRKSLKLSHISPREFKPLNEYIWNNKIIFSFVRNPYDRIVSYFHYYRNRYGLNFKDFVNEYILIRKNKFMCNQNFWTTDRKGNSLMTYILKFESLQNDFQNICKIINIEYQELPWLKKSERRPYQEYYNKQTQEVVKLRCRKDFDLFNYDINL